MESGVRGKRAGPLEELAGTMTEELPLGPARPDDEMTAREGSGAKQKGKREETGGKGRESSRAAWHCSEKASSR